LTKEYIPLYLTRALSFLIKDGRSIRRILEEHVDICRLCAIASCRTENGRRVHERNGHAKTQRTRRVVANLRNEAIARVVPERETRVRTFLRRRDAAEARKNKGK